MFTFENVPNIIGFETQYDYNRNSTQENYLVKSNDVSTIFQWKSNQQWNKQHIYIEIIYGDEEKLGRQERNWCYQIISIKNLLAENK